MRFLITIARMYPGRSALTLVSLLFAGVAEGLSLLLLLPSLNLLTNDTAQGPGNGLSGLGHMLTEALSAIGVTPTVGALLLVILICLALKAVFLLMSRPICDSPCFAPSWLPGGSSTCANLWAA